MLTLSPGLVFANQADILSNTGVAAQDENSITRLGGVWDGGILPGGNTSVPFTIRFASTEGDVLTGTWGADPTNQGVTKGKDWGHLLDVKETSDGVVFFIQADPSLLKFDMTLTEGLLQGEITRKDRPNMKASFERVSK
tara:strand:+ start:1908 stop:2324 length:417 start_codon:yes stop_codon:yes gene_type:complete